MDLTVRAARADDYEAVVELTRDTWPNRDVSDYVPDVFHDWLGERDRRRVLVAEVDGSEGIAGLCQGVVLSDHEAWAGGLRVAPAVGGEGVSRRLSEVLFDWAADRGAVVVRNMVFSWNGAGLGQSRGVGFEPCTAFRWATIGGDGDLARRGSPEAGVAGNPDAAWGFWRRSDACTALTGLGLDRDEPWAVSELARDDFREAADGTAVVTVGGDGVAGVSYRVREVERESEGDGAETVAEYGVAAWDDAEAADALFDAVASDAKTVGADRARVAIPETPRHVPDAAYARADVDEGPTFVFERDLTSRR